MEKVPETILCFLWFPENSSRFSELESGGALLIDDRTGKEGILEPLSAVKLIP